MRFSCEADKEKTKKAEPQEGPCQLMCVDCFASSSEALPFSVMVLKLAIRSSAPIFSAIVQEVTDSNKSQHNSYHRTPSFRLSLDIDAQIAAQMFIGVFALEIGFTRIDMSFVLLIKVVLDSVFCHGITSRVYFVGFLVVSFV